MTDISHERLCSLVEYNPSTGEFYAAAPRQGIRHRKRLGHVESNGYRRLMIEGDRFLAHRLAWFYVHRQWPDKDLDHKNLERDDNRIENLRVATDSQNHANTRAKVSKSGLKGAHWNGARNYWQSYIRVNGRSKFLGRFDNPQAAHEAYAAAAISIHGEFARVA